MVKIRTFFCSLQSFKMYTVIVLFFNSNSWFSSTVVSDILVALSAAWGAALLIINLFSKEKRFYKGKLFWLFAAFCLSYCVTIALNFKVALFLNLKDLLWFFICVTVLLAPNSSSQEKNQIDFNMLLSVFIVLSFFFSLGSLPFVFLNEGSRSDFGIWGFYAHRLYGLYRSPNYASVYSVISVMATLYSLKWGKKQSVFRILLSFNLLIQYLYLVYAGSITGKVVLIVCLVMFFLYNVLTSERLLGKLKQAGLFLVCIVLVFASMGVTKQITQNIVNSMHSGSAPSSSSLNSSKTSDPSNSDVSSEPPVSESSAPASSESSAASSQESSAPSNNGFSLERHDLGANYELGNGRVFVWKISLKVFKDYPVFGTTMRGYKTIVKDYDDSVRSQNRDVTLENDFVSLLVCTGLAGLSIMLVIILIILTMIVRTVVYVVKRKQWQNLGKLWMALSIVLIVGVTTMSTDAIIFSNKLQSAIFWISLSIVLEQCRLTEKERAFGLEKTDRKKLFFKRFFKKNSAV